MSPTIISTISSMETRPSVPPYSSMTSAIWVRVACIRTSRSSAGIERGTKSTGRKMSAVSSSAPKSIEAMAGSCGSPVSRRFFRALREIVDEIADVHHAARIVERLAVNRQPRMAGGAKNRQHLAQRRARGNGDNVGARNHGVRDPQLVQAQHIFEQRALLRRHVAGGFLQRVLDILAHRGRREAQQHPQPLEKIGSWRIASAILRQQLRLAAFNFRRHGSSSILCPRRRQSAASRRKGRLSQAFPPRAAPAPPWPRPRRGSRDHSRSDAKSHG